MLLYWFSDVSSEESPERDKQRNGSSLSLPKAPYLYLRKRVSSTFRAQRIIYQHPHNRPLQHRSRIRIGENSWDVEKLDQMVRGIQTRPHILKRGNNLKDTHIRQVSFLRIRQGRMSCFGHPHAISHSRPRYSRVEPSIFALHDREGRQVSSTGKYSIPHLETYQLSVIYDRREMA